MITAYYRHEGQILDSKIAMGMPMPASTLWVDLLNPDENERAAVSKTLGLDLPTSSEMEEIEASSRLYVEGQAVYLTTDILVGTDTPSPSIDELTIVLAPQALVTIRFCEPRAIDIFAARIKRHPDLCATLDDTVLSLLDAVVDRTADVLEVIGRHVDDVSAHVFRVHDDGHEVSSVMPLGRRRTDRHKKTKPKHTEKLNDILRGIGMAGDMTHKVRDALSGMIRLVAFLGPIMTVRLTSEQLTRFKTLDRDLRSLVDFSQFLSHESSFLLEATLGQINIEQNNIIKIFSVVAVGFLPPTLVASIWGMNFRYMPELDAAWGYPLALFVIVLSAIIPIVYFKHRGWL
jgi:magnesium transporter